MPLGIPGFPEQRRYVLLDHRPGSIFRWLQAVDEPSLAFVVIDVLLVAADYPIPGVRKAIDFVNLEPDEDVAVLAICTIPGPPDAPTANLLAPLGIGVRSRRGAQVVLHDSGFDPRETFLDKLAS